METKVPAGLKEATHAHPEYPLIRPPPIHHYVASVKPPKDDLKTCLFMFDHVTTSVPQTQPRLHCVLRVFIFFPNLTLCPCPSFVTPVISWCAGATSACVRQGLCVVAWYSPFS